MTLAPALLAAPPIVDRTPRTAYLHPGQLVAFSGPAVMTTVLGSCVAVCLYDQQAEIGGMNHFVLSEATAADRDSVRYARPACDHLLEQVCRLGARRERLAAKLFGGCSALAGAAGRATVGERNVAAARAWLLEQRIPVEACEVGGVFGRKLSFEIPGAVVWVRTLNRAAK